MRSTDTNGSVNTAIDIRCGDCLELMKDIPDGSIDMILTDLPYQVTANEWDRLIPFEPLWKQYLRVAKENAAIVLFSQMPFTIDLINSQRSLFRYEWIYMKRNPVGFMNANKMPMKAHENICVFYRKLPTYNPQWWYAEPYIRKDRIQSKNYRPLERTPTICEDGRRYPLDVIEFNNASLTWSHPTEKPIDLCEYLIKTYTDLGGVVLDSCMGSGTTGVACVQTERSFVGIEMNQEYFDIAAKRIKEAEMNGIQITMDGLQAVHND